MISRRGFLGVLAGAIAAASAGLPVSAAPSTEPAKPNRRKVNARHLYQYSAHSVPPYGEGFVHRIDVIVFDPHLRKHEQWAVDIVSMNPELNAERELAPALATLGNKLAEFDCELGEIRSYSMDEWLADKKARADWAKMLV